MRVASLLLALASGALAACGGGERAAEAAGGPVRLVYWTSQNPQERTVADSLTARWNRTHPDIQVTVQPIPAGQSSEEVILASIVAGTTPDVCSNIWPGVLHDLVRAQGVLAPRQDAGLRQPHDGARADRAARALPVGGRRTSTSCRGRRTRS